MFTMQLKSMGNPDHNQYCGESILSPNEKKEFETLEECQASALRYIERFNLGSGNFISPVVKENGKETGRISYNGRFWPK